MMKNSVFILFLIIADILLVIINFQLIGGLGVFVIDNTINTLSFLSLIVTICIAIFVPFLIKKAIDDNRGVKLLLVDEMKDLLLLCEQNHEMVAQIYSDEATIEDCHRDAIRECFFDAELKIDSLRAQLSVAYPRKQHFADEIFNCTLKYKQFLTDGKFMTSSYKVVDYDFYRSEKNAFAELKKTVVTNIHNIHRF